MAVRLAARVALLVLTFSSSLFAQGLADDQTRRQALDLYRMGQEYMAAERFELAVNLRTAQRLGLILPSPLLLQATQVVA